MGANIDAKEIRKNGEIRALKEKINSEIHQITNSTWHNHYKKDKLTGANACIAKNEQHLSNIALLLAELQMLESAN